MLPPTVSTFGTTFAREMEKILVVDDEQDICDILQFNLETEGYEVCVATSAEEALQLPIADFSILLLDVMMGEMSGFELARQLRSKPETEHIPIIFITALDDEEHLIKGLNIGADDYMAKPLSMREVKARVKTVLRRFCTARQAKEPAAESIKENATSRIIAHETLVIDTEKKTVSVDNESISLTRLEYELLKHFMSNPGKVYSRDQLLSEVWPNDTIVLDRTVDVNITRIRKKIGRYGKSIKSRFGFGYTFEP